MHTVEETSRLLRLLVAAELRLQFFDTRIGALERLVLDEGCLHQRVGGLRRASQAVRDHASAAGSRGLFSSLAKRSNSTSTNSCSCGVMRPSLAFTSAAYVGYRVG